MDNTQNALEFDDVEHYAVIRARRIAARSTEGPFDDELAGWLLSSLQQWWMAHCYHVADPGVADHFCTAVNAALPHLDRDLRFQAIARGVLTVVRVGGPGARATAKGLVTLLGLDPDPTPLGLLLDEWEGLSSALDGEAPPVAAGHLAIMLRQLVNLVADPETTDARRSELIATATTTLGAIAYAREAQSDLWSAAGDLSCIWGHDSETALLARLVLCSELLEMLEREST